MAENEVIAVVPVGYPGYQPYTGAIKVRADCCGVEAWLGPRSQAKKAADGTRTMCVLCITLQGAEPDQLQSLGNPEDTKRRN